MNRIVNIIVRPGKEWEAISRETATVGALSLKVVVPLCVIPAVATVIGMTFFDTGWDALHGYTLPRERIIGVGAANFIFALVSVFMLALIFHFLAPVESHVRKSFADALKVAAFGSIPVLLSGVFLVLPVMVMLTLVAAVHSFFLYNVGLKTVLRVPEAESAMLLAIAIVMLCAASAVIGAVASKLGVF
jgi:hypothetical protein